MTTAQVIVCAILAVAAVGLVALVWWLDRKYPQFEPQDRERVGMPPHKYGRGR